MRKKFQYLPFIPILLFVNTLLLAAGVITHQPEVQHIEGKPLTIYAMVSSDVEVENVRLLYRKVGESGYIEIYMIAYGDIWRGEIPGEYLVGEDLQYFIASTLSDGSLITFPVDDPENSPITVAIQPPPPQIEEQPVDTMKKEEIMIEKGEILIFSPLPGSEIPFDDVFIAASLFNIDSLDESSIRITLDGRDVTSLSTVSVDFVTYEPITLPPGQHTVQITAQTLKKRVLVPIVWSFMVSKKKEEEIEKEFTYSGRINGGYSLDQIEDQSLSISRTNASFTGKWRYIRFKTDLKLTTEEDPYKQPRNRYRFQLLAGKYFSLNFGDFNSRLSPFTLDGKRVRGLEANFKFGWVNFHLIKGELDRVIEGRPDTGESYTFEGVDVIEDTVTERKQFTYHLNRKGYTFQKNIFAGRLSFGSGRVFQLGINWLKAKDDIGSVSPILENANIRIDLDSSGTNPLSVPVGNYTYNELNQLISSLGNYSLDIPKSGWSGASPQDNIVIGSDLKLYLFRKKIGMEAGWAFSMLNTNIWDGAFTKSELDTLGILGDSLLDGKIAESFDIPIDPKDYEDIFVLNLNQIPLIPIDPDSAQLADNPVGVILRMPSLAYNVKMLTNFLYNQFTFEFLQVGSEFNSLGNPYIQKNNREYTLSDRIRLLSNRLFINLMYKHQDDDIMRTVTHITTTNTFATGINIFPGGNLPSLNFGFRVQSRDNGKTNLDTVSVDTTESGVLYTIEDLRDFTNAMNTTVGLNYRFHLLGMDHNISSNVIFVKKEDQFEDRDTAFVSPDISSKVFTLSVVTQYSFPLRTTAVISLNNSEFGKNAIYGTQHISSLSLNGLYDFLKGKLRVKAGINLTLGSGNEIFNRYSISGGINYRFTNTLGIRFDSEVRAKNTDNETKTSTLLRVSLNYTF